MKTNPATQKKLVSTALQLFLQQGIKKTTVDDVARQAGFTRVTAYRYFSDKQTLVQAAFMQIPAALQTVLTQLNVKQEHNIEIVLDHIIERLAALPGGNFPACLAELERLYPHLAAEFHNTRKTAINQIFQVLFQTAAQQGRLRQELNPQVVQAYFMTAVVNVLENPQLASSDLSPQEIFATVKSIFLYGILSS